ncbi:MAG: ABC transporter ATP-binding protein [Alphaproteobacteria bacterium]
MNAPDASTILEVRNLSVSYGKVRALNDANFIVRKGQIITVIGPNGAGKSTALGALMGILASTGRILLHGEDQGRTSIEGRVSRGLTLVPEKRELFGSMSVADNLLMGAYRCHKAGERDQRESMDRVFERFPRLRERRRQLAGTLSGGERAMLVLGRALMSKPRLLMLDEPSLGLAPKLVKTIFQIISELRKTGVSILMVEQNARAALEISDYAYVLENGRIALEGPSQALASEARIVASYLGGNVGAADPRSKDSA